ncbi:JAB domain-containing protein [Myroides sp. LJL110]
MSEKQTIGKNIISSHCVYEFMIDKLRDIDHEQFWVLLLDNANVVKREVFLSKGTITATLVDLRLLFKQALLHGGIGLILIHNHPSGKLQPSRADISLTKKISEAAAILDLKVLDHLIISNCGYYSFADEGLIV